MLRVGYFGFCHFEGKRAFIFVWWGLFGFWCCGGASGYFRGQSNYAGFKVILVASLLLFVFLIATHSTLSPPCFLFFLTLCSVYWVRGGDVVPCILLFSQEQSTSENEEYEE